MNDTQYTNQELTRGSLGPIMNDIYLHHILMKTKSKFETILCQQWAVRRTWYERDVSLLFMTIMLTFCVTVMGWIDVLDSDRSDFRRRRAVDISSYVWVLVIFHVNSK